MAAPPQKKQKIVWESCGKMFHLSENLHPKSAKYVGEKTHFWKFSDKVKILSTYNNFGCLKFAAV